MEIIEGKASVITGEGKLSKKIEGFYNPEMKLNRDIAVWIVNKLKPKKIFDANSSTGVRAIRFYLEANAKNITASEINIDSFKMLQKNIIKNNARITALNKDANEIMFENEFDYIDIDHFGSPVGFLEKAVLSVKKNGVLALTATDIGCLSGRFIGACLRKYLSRPMPCMFSNELGIRILAYRAIIEGEKICKNFMPVFCHAGKHYYRVYLKNVPKAAGNIGFILICRKCLNFKVSEKNDDICCSKRMDFAGPLYIGKLFENNLIKGFDLIPNILQEAKIGTVGYYDTHYLAKKLNLPKTPKIDGAVNNLIKAGFKASKTHFSPNGIKTDANLKAFLGAVF